MVGAIDVEIAVGFACYRPRSRPNGAGEVVLECSEEDAREVALWPVEVSYGPSWGDTTKEFRSKTLLDQ
jgi:hypothetical protein